jgi:argininosuccinate synthase
MNTSERLRGQRVVLAFSGGLDTSFCAVWLTRELGAEVVTVCVDTGGFAAEGLVAVEQRALQLGAVAHHNIDARSQVFDRFMAYVIKGEVLRGGVYPVSVAAERTAQTEAVVAVAQAEGAIAVAHGSTGAGNDQVRFDVALATLAPDLEIIAPVRELGWSRDEEAAWLAEHGVALPEDIVSYSRNDGLVGNTIGGVETHDSWSMPPASVYSMTAEKDANRVAEELLLGFQAGAPTSLDGCVMDGPDLLAELNARAGAHGFGRGVHVGDTILGVKGRIVFEAPGALLLVTAHRELAKLVQTRMQAHWARQLGDFWGEQLHLGLYYDPALRDAEALLDSASARVSGEVKLLLHQGHADVVGVRSPHSLLGAQGALYGEQMGAWTGAEAAGFARLHGMQCIIAAARDRAAAAVPDVRASADTGAPVAAPDPVAEAGA